MRAFFLFVAIAAVHTVSGQCYPEMHNTSWNENWISCAEKPNPNSTRPTGHWIMYDFGHTYRLGAGKVWNINSEEFLDSGFKEFYVDYSIDGKQWKELGMFNLPRATGLKTYEGDEIMNFVGDTARFVLLTAANNWGGECYGLAEVKFDVVDIVSRLHTYPMEECFTVSVYPNPHIDQFSVALRSECKGNISLRLFDHTGKLVRGEAFTGGENIYNKDFTTAGLASGLYHLVITQNGSIARYPIVKASAR